MSVGIYFRLLSFLCNTWCACKLLKPICLTISLFNLSTYQSRVELALIVDHFSNLTRGEKINWMFRPFLVDESFTYSGVRPPILRSV